MARRSSLQYRRFSVPPLPKVRPSVRNIAEEALAGLLWMHLNFPKTVSLTELEAHAMDLANAIRLACPDTVIEQKIRTLQARKRCPPLSPAAIAQLARRSIVLVRSAGV